MAKLFSMSVSIPGVEVWVNYNINNLRITTVEWTLPGSNIVGHIQIWNNNTLFYNRVIAAPDSGSENIPGNHTVVQYPLPGGGTSYVLPSYLTYRINLETTS